MNQTSPTHQVELDRIIHRCTSSVPEQEKSPLFVNTISQIRKQTLEAYDQALWLEDILDKKERPQILEVLLKCIEEYKSENQDPSINLFLSNTKDRIFQLYFH